MYVICDAPTVITNSPKVILKRVIKTSKVPKKEDTLARNQQILKQILKT